MFKGDFVHDSYFSHATLAVFVLIRQLLADIRLKSSAEEDSVSASPVESSDAPADALVPTSVSTSEPLSPEAGNHR